MERVGNPVFYVSTSEQGKQPDPAYGSLSPDFFTFQCENCGNHESARRDAMVADDGTIVVFQSNTPFCCSTPMIQIG